MRSVSFAIITVSDTRKASSDSSGDAIRDLMSEVGHKLTRRAIVADDADQIQKALRECIEDRNVQAVLLTGGTGISKRDVTLEAVEHFREKDLPGFGELFRSLSYDEIGSAAMMSRSSAFVSEGKLVFCLPGSEKAVRLAVRTLIAPEIGHMVWEANR